MRALLVIGLHPGIAGGLRLIQTGERPRSFDLGTKRAVSTPVMILASRSSPVAGLASSMSMPHSCIGPGRSKRFHACFGFFRGRARSSPLTDQAPINRPLRRHRHLLAQIPGHPSGATVTKSIGPSTRISRRDDNAHEPREFSSRTPAKRWWVERLARCSSVVDVIGEDLQVNDGIFAARWPGGGVPPTRQLGEVRGSSASVAPSRGLLGSSGSVREPGGVRHRVAGRAHIVGVLGEASSASYAGNQIRPRARPRSTASRRVVTSSLR